MSARPATEGELRRSRVPWPVIKGTVKWMVFFFVAYLVWPTVAAGFKGAWNEIRKVNPAFILLGFALEIAALFCYSLLTRSALPDQQLSVFRLFRIQLSTKAISSIMPGGSAAGSALGYRLLTLSGVDNTDAGFALATVGLGSAVVLNVLLLAGLVVSIVIRGGNEIYGTAAVAGIVLISIAALIVVGLLKGQRRAERVVRSVAKRMRFEPDRAVDVIRQVAMRLRSLLGDRRLLLSIIGWALANWLFDAAALWVFLRAFGESLPVDALIVSFGLANVVAAIPLMPGGLGTVELTYTSVLVGFGLPKRIAAVGVAGYRFAQYWFPILLGAIAYLSLRVGPWSIERRDQLGGLRDAADDALNDDTSGIEWAEKYGRRVVSGAASTARAESPTGPPSP